MACEGSVDSDDSGALTCGSGLSSFFPWVSLLLSSFPFPLVFSFCTVYPGSLHISLVLESSHYRTLACASLYLHIVYTPFHRFWILPISTYSMSFIALCYVFLVFLFHTVCCATVYTLSSLNHLLLCLYVLCSRVVMLSYQAPRDFLQCPLELCSFLCVQCMPEDQISSS